MNKMIRVNLGVYDIQTAWVINNGVRTSLSTTKGEAVDRKLHIVSFESTMYRRSFNFTEDKLIHYSFWFPHIGFTTDCEACMLFERRTENDYDPHSVLKEHIQCYLDSLELVREESFRKLSGSYYNSSFGKCNLDSIRRCLVLLKHLSGITSDDDEKKFIGFPLDPFKRMIIEAKINEVNDLTHVTDEEERRLYQILRDLRNDEMFSYEKIEQNTGVHRK